MFSRILLRRTSSRVSCTDWTNLRHPSMFVIAYVALGGLVTAAAGIYILLNIWQTKETGTVINNPAFLAFQHTYFRIYFLALFAEWLQGPYLYKLYSHYGFIDTQIAVIYVCGFASSIIFGTFASLLSDSFGRKKVCILFTLTYSICCITKVSRRFEVLVFGRVLGGISTSLLFSAFDAWYVHEHLHGKQFPPEWIEETFIKATFFNGVIAIGAGVSANVIAEYLKFGPVAPFLLAVPFLICAGILIHCKWEENYGKQGKALRPCLDSLKLILGNQKIFLTGAVQSLFESVMYIFVFLWTPVLEPVLPPLGIVFACFMACILLGSMCFKFYVQARWSVTKLITAVIYFAMMANLAASFTSEQHPISSFGLFLFIELLCGLYFPAMGNLRFKVLPQGSQAAIMNWFRIPLNLIAALGLVAFHDTHTAHGISALFGLCAFLLCLAGLCSIRLHYVMSLNQENMTEQSQETSVQIVT